MSNQLVIYRDGKWKKVKFPASGDERHIIQRLYDSEINFQIYTFWDGGFNWALGTEYGGFRADGNADTFDEACAALRKAALGHYPESTFAKNERTMGRAPFAPSTSMRSRRGARVGHARPARKKS